MSQLATITSIYLLLCPFPPFYKVFLPLTLISFFSSLQSLHPFPTLEPMLLFHRIPNPIHHPFNFISPFPENPDSCSPTPLSIYTTKPYPHTHAFLFFLWLLNFIIILYTICFLLPMFLIEVSFSCLIYIV